MQIPLFKVIFTGDNAVGKTSLINLYCKTRYEVLPETTIGLDFQMKQVTLPEGTIKLSIWDLAGQQRFEYGRTSFYRGAHTCALVYDVTRPKTLVDLNKWHGEITSICPEIPFVVVGNKVDLLEDEDDSNAMEYALSIRANFLHTSAFSGDGVAFLFETLARNSMRVTGYC